MNRFVDTLMSDLYKSEDVIVLDGSIKPEKNFFLKMLRKVHLSGKINKIIELPMKRIWINSTLPAFEENEKYCFIFIDRVPPAMDFSYLKKLKKKNGGKIKYLLFLFNPVELFKDTTMRNLKRMDFDYIFSYDFDDSKKYGFLHYNVPYSIMHKIDNVVDKDIYNVSWSKGRLPTLHRIYEEAEKNGVTCQFRITDVKKKDQMYKNQIVYNQKAEYDEIVNGLIKCNCILDVLSPGHTGVSVRYYEAVCYNKKLLTNNKNVVNLPFYNPDYIHVFEKPEDIDWEWVKERITIDYHYDGRFSPTHLIDKIIELEEEREKEENGKKQDT